MFHDIAHKDMKVIQNPINSLLEIPLTLSGGDDIIIGKICNIILSFSLKYFNN